MSKIVSNKKLINQAMNNSYNILMGNCELEDVVIEGEVWSAHDPSKGLDEVDFEMIIEYFADKDEFEKCIELRKIKDNQNK